MPICPACDSTNTEADSFMGQLGNLKHYRCRYCGMDYNERTPRKRKPMKRRKKNPCRHRRNPSTGMMLFLAAAGVGAYFLYKSAIGKGYEAALVSEANAADTAADAAAKAAAAAADAAAAAAAAAKTAAAKSTVEEVLSNTADKNTAVSGFGLHGYFKEMPGTGGSMTFANNRRGR